MRQDRKKVVVYHYIQSAWLAVAKQWRSETEISYSFSRGFPLNNHWQISIRFLMSLYLVFFPFLLEISEQTLHKTICTNR